MLDGTRLRRHSPDLWTECIFTLKPTPSSTSPAPPMAPRLDQRREGRHRRAWTRHCSRAPGAEAPGYLHWCHSLVGTPEVPHMLSFHVFLSKEGKVLCRGNCVLPEPEPLGRPSIFFRAWHSAQTPRGSPSRGLDKAGPSGPTLEWVSENRYRRACDEALPNHGAGVSRPLPGRVAGFSEATQL